MIILKERNFFQEQNLYTSINDVPSSVPHQHEFIEVFYVVNGTATHFINNKKHILNPGDLYIIRPMDKHYFRAINTTPLLHRNFFIRKTEFQRICNFIDSKLFDFLLNSLSIVRTTVNLKTINCFEKQLQLFSGNNILISILIEILVIFINYSVSDFQFFPLWLQHLLSFMDKPDSFKKNIHELLQDTHLSFPYVCTQFKKYLGVTITEYRQTAKLQYAYSLILASNLSIEQISEQCGFASRNHFYKEFKKKFGVIPGSLRKKRFCLTDLS